MINYNEYVGFLDRSCDQGILKDTSGRFLTQALFKETNNPNLSYRPIYTMGYDDSELPSARRIYESSTDEYEAALKLVGNMDHWRRLTGINADGNYVCQWFMLGTDRFEGLLQWREDMKLRDESLAKAILVLQAKSGNVPAAKALMEYNKKTGAGRPSNKSTSSVDAKKADVLNRMKNAGLVAISGTPRSN